MEKLIFVPLLFILYALFELVDASYQLFDSLTTIQLSIKFQPFTNAQLRAIGAKGRTKDELILSLAIA